MLVKIIRDIVKSPNESRENDKIMIFGTLFISWSRFTYDTVLITAIAYVYIEFLKRI